MNLNTVKATIALGVAALVAIMLAGWLLLIGPTAGEIGDTRAEISDTQDRTSLLTLQLRSLESQADDLTVTARAAERIAQIWPPTADQPGFFRAVNDAAVRSGFATGDITALSPTAPVLVGPDGLAITDDAAATTTESGTEADPVEAAYAIQTVTVSMEGTSDQARAFLRRLERLDRAFLVQSVALTRGEDGAVTLEISGSTYVAPPVGAPSAEADADPETPPDAPEDSDGSGTDGSGTDGTTQADG